ncbi:MAG: CHAD domain-containing protein [Sulfurospirillaceae bacterium]|nr:CHAD domain-containing protein [Sulfurospirillaceae bacterium]
MYNLLFVNYLMFNLLNALKNANAVHDNSDIEHLHKFRVYTRRVVSLLKLFMPEEKKIIKSLKRALKYTNVLRDLDVLLLTINEKKFPNLKNEIRQYRINEYKRVWTKETLDEISSIILNASDELHTLPGIDSYLHMIEVAEQYFADTMHIYRTLSSEHDSDKKFHEVRIRFKIARYAFEFLKNCQIAEEESKIEECKKAQKSFGDVQDIYSQLQWFKEYSKTNPSKECTKIINKLTKKLKKERQNITLSSS